MAIENNQHQLETERAKHLKVLMDIRKLMTMPEGRTVFKYLIDAGGVADPPIVFPDEKLTYKYMGLLEFGNSIFKLLTQADPDVAAHLLTQVIKEKNATESNS